MYRDTNTTTSGPMFNDQMREILGTGVFNSDGEMWKCVLNLLRIRGQDTEQDHLDSTVL